MKAACFSVAAMDYFPQQNRHFAGGNALNQSVRLTKMGVECTFVGALGNDESGDRLLSLLRKNEVDLSLIERVDGSTATNRIINDSRGERFGEEGAWKGGVFENYQINEEQWKNIEYFDLWITHSSCPNFKQALHRNKNSKLFVDYLHLPDFNLLEDTVDYVKVAYVGGNSGMVELLNSLSKKTNTLIVLTMGHEGSLCFSRGKQYFQEALETSVVDTTGCGDAFQAGFTYSFMCNGKIEDALLEGAEQGRLATKHLGGVPW